MKSLAFANCRRSLRLIAVGVFVCGLSVAPWVVADQQTAQEGKGKKMMRVFYLEIVTPDVDAICATYAATHGITFGQPNAGFGNARTAAMPDGGMVGVRAPMRETEVPVVRPYWLVKDINAAVATAENSGGKIAHPPMEIPGHGTFAIYILGGIEHGLWQK